MREAMAIWGCRFEEDVVGSIPLGAGSSTPPCTHVPPSGNVDSLLVQMTISVIIPNQHTQLWSIILPEKPYSVWSLK
jgi:hypothetical protein